MSQSAYNKALAEWVKNWKEAHLSPEVRKLIVQANYDLWYGPVQDGSYNDSTESDDEWVSYPGFAVACERISVALQQLPSNLYIDIETGNVLDHEPESEKCESCDGQGYYYTIDHERFTCDACCGLGCFDPASTWYYIEKNDLRSAVVGEELYCYLS